MTSEMSSQKSISRSEDTNSNFISLNGTTGGKDTLIPPWNTYPQTAYGAPLRTPEPKVFITCRHPIFNATIPAVSSFHRQLIKLTIRDIIIGITMYIIFITNLLLREEHVPYNEITSPITISGRWDERHRPIEARGRSTVNPN